MMKAAGSRSWPTRAAAIAVLFLALTHPAAAQTPAGQPANPTPRPSAVRPGPKGTAHPKPAPAPAPVRTTPATGADSSTATIEFTTPDGTHVVLLPQAGPPLVHWAVATPCGAQVDPPAAPGTALAAMYASLRGTWTTGSSDAAREQEALAALDRAETDLALAPRTDGKEPVELAAEVGRLRGAAAALCDARAFRRVLAATPTQDLEVAATADVAVLRLVTTPFAVPTVARLLLERREQPALRGVREELQHLQEQATAAWDQEPLSALRAELLALAFPGHAIARAGDRPVVAAFQRALATATWARSQHPSRTVHVLVGNFDPDTVRLALTQAFAQTALPAVEPLVRPTPRAQPAVRRSLVPGARFPAAIIAYTIPAELDPLLAATAANWLAGGPGSWLHGELVRAGRPKVEVAVRAPWAEASPPGLLVVEVRDPGGGDRALADQVLDLLARKTKKAIRPGELPAAFGVELRRFEQATRSPRDVASLFAQRLAADPASSCADALPHNIAFAELVELLQQVLDGNPIVIEWRDS